jgi:tRNA A58 N-methylase Trm61
VATRGERFDRAVLDMAEPWVPLEALHQVLEGRPPRASPS